MRGPAVGTPAVVIGSGVAAFQSIPARPLVGGAADLGGSCDGSSLSCVRSLLDSLAGNAALISGYPYFLPYLVKFLFR